MGNLENALQVGGYFGGISIQRYLNMERLAANGAALANISGRTSGMTAAYFDIFNNLNAYSAGIMDTTKTTILIPTLAGETVLDAHVDVSNADTQWFKVGQEVSVQDDVNKEYVTVTRAEISSDITTYDRSTPITVVSSAFTTSKDARPQVLSNGWIVSCAMNTSTYILYFYVSKDNGATTTPLCSVSVAGNGLSFCLASKGTMLYCGFNKASTGHAFVSFDATTVSNSDLVSNAVVINTPTINIFGSGMSLTLDNTNGIYFTNCAKYTGYTNSFNISYVKGTISAVDGSVSWGSVEQVTTDNAAYNNTTPTIVVKNDGNPLIVFLHSDGSTWYIRAANYTGTWTVNINIAPSIYAYAQSSPDAIVDENGILFCCWQGKDATDSSSVNIRCSKSTDNGVTWTKADGTVGHDKLTSGNSYDQQLPSITVDKNNKIYLTFYGIISGQFNDQAQIRLITFDAVWSSISNLTSNTTNNATTPSTCLNYNDFTSPILIYKDTQSSSVKFRGIFSVTTQTPHLEVTPLVNAYKVNTKVYRSLGSVDTVNKRLKFSEGFQSATTYDRSTPTTVVGSAYDTSGNGGRKLVRLDNGWLVSVVFDANPYVRWEVSKDNGATWLELTYMGYNFGSGANHSVAISSSGNNVYTLVTGNTYAYCYRFDATTVPSSSLTGSYYTLIESQDTIGSGCSIEVDSLGYLQATWCSKNATYPNSFNIRYSKSTDGGVTWSAVTQLSTYNTTGYDYTNPCIVINKTTNYPVIIMQRISTTYNINVFQWNGTSWGAYSVYSVSSYSQSNPSAVVDSAGTIHVVWHGIDATDSTYNNVRYSKSTDGGVTWSTMLKLTTGNTLAQYFTTIACDSSNNVYVAWSYADGVNWPIKWIKYSAGSWGSTTSVGTPSTIGYPSMCANYTNFEYPLFIFKDYVGGVSTVKFYGKFSSSVNLPFLEEDVRYTITPPSPVSQIVSWDQYDIDQDFSIANKFSLVATGANEVYGNPTLKTTIIEAGVTAEDQNVYIAPANNRITKRITLNRTNISINKSISQLLGAVGY